jgi:surface polysaccharide O-acyltransferase-like enzyme
MAGNLTMTQNIESPRYFALDRVRATAMLLGVVYHTMMFRMFVGGGGPPGPMGMGGSSRYVQDFMHSFRMPLFFLISGFFGRMMFIKYGPSSYLKKRWIRIGIPLLVGIFTFGPLYVLTREVVSSGPGGGGPSGGGMPGRGGPMMPGPRMGGPPAVGLDDQNELPPPPAGFVPPPLLRFDEDNDGSLSPAEWAKAQKELPPFPGMNSGGPGGGPGGPGGPGGGGFPGGGGGGIGQRIFGQNSRLFQLNHLWFLWYLLVFITIGPVIGALFRFARPTGQWLFQKGWAPLALGLISTPAIMITASMFGWSLGLAPAIFKTFPDFLISIDPDMLFYFLFFMTGWALHSSREHLAVVARLWIPYVVIGIIAFASSTILGDMYSQRRDLPQYPAIRAIAYALYCIASAFISFGFIGFFQKHCDRPSRTWRYLADTALWVYLIHQPLVLIGLSVVRPLSLGWVPMTAIVSLSSVAMALFLYEAIVRPTDLIRWLGPANSRREQQEVVAVGDGLSARI